MIPRGLREAPRGKRVNRLASESIHANADTDLTAAIKADQRQ
jgi:hypothetical protein